MTDKRLFVVKVHGSKRKEDIKGFFSNKMEAKKIRDELNEKHEDTVFCVSYGPDHKLYKGDHV